MSEETTTESKPEPGTGHTLQTFLVGEHIYLRTVQEGDEKWAASWRQGLIRRSVSAIESWIEDDLKDEEDLHLVIVRKSDDRVVGSLTRETWRHNIWYSGYADPLFGEQADVWLAEAYTMALQWSVDEHHKLVASINRVGANQPIILEALQAIGGRISSTFREGHRVGDTFTDWHIVTYLNREWVQTLGDPDTDEKPRTGTGEPRPVIAPVQVAASDLPTNAMRVGPRVYLRPLQKADAAEVVKWQRKETEPFWSSGRYVSTTTSLEKWYVDMGKDDVLEEVVFAVCVREDDTFIGVVGIDGIDWDHRTAESLSEFHNLEYRAKGYGTEAKHLLFDYAFNTLGLHSLQSWVMYTNTRSAAALRKQGYHDVGIEPWLVRRAGGYEHFGTYELLADEWRAMPRASVEEAGDLAG